MGIIMFFIIFTVFFHFFPIFKQFYCFYRIFLIFCPKSSHFGHREVPREVFLFFCMIYACAGSFFQILSEIDYPPLDFPRPPLFQRGQLFFAGIVSIFQKTENWKKILRAFSCSLRRKLEKKSFFRMVLPRFLTFQR